MPGKNVWGFIKHLENNLKTFFQTLNDSSLNPNWYLITMYLGTFSVSFYYCKWLRRPLGWEFLPVQVGITRDTIWPVSPHHLNTAFSYRNTCPKSAINLYQNQILGRFQTYLFIMKPLSSISSVPGFACSCREIKNERRWEFWQLQSSSPSVGESRTQVQE